MSNEHPATPVVTQRDESKQPIFVYVFIAIQVLFLLWVIAGAKEGTEQPTDCGSLSAKACNDAENVGTAIGVALVIALWCAVDFILGVGYAIYRLAKRP